MFAIETAEEILHRNYMVRIENDENFWQMKAIQITVFSVGTKD